MTVADLRRLLADLPDDMPVAVDAYERGITVEDTSVRVVETRAVDGSSVCGELEEEPTAADLEWSWLADQPRGPRVLLLSRHEAAE